MFGMSELFIIIILGVVQGLTEFLPISSSGHLFLLENILGISGSDQLFLTVILHFGTLVAVVIYYYKDILALIKTDHKRLWWLILATLPATIVMLFVKKLLANGFDNRFLPFGFLLTAILLIFASKKQATSKEFTAKTALIMGVGQAVAVFPAISRSGTTICVGLLVGADKKQVANFSFLMSIPVILGSTIVELMDINTFSISLLNLSVGVVCSLLSGLIAIHFMLKLVQKAKLWVFSVYLFALFALTLTNAFFVPLW